MTTTDHLLRKFAPIPATGWKQIDDEAKTRLTPRLAARRLVEWSGPHGWAHSATNLGRTAPLESAPPGTKSEKRGGDFILDVGQDFSIGYTSHDAERVTLYLEESFSFRVTEPDAIVVLTEG